MLEESASAWAPSIWASMNSWFTPAVLFVLLNLVIGTIVFTSTLTSQKQHHNNSRQTDSQNDPHHPHIARSPSILQRLKSINFSAHFRSQEPRNSSLLYNPSPDSDTPFNVERAHQAQHLETQSHYFFPQENLETPQPQAHYIFEQIHQQKPQESQAHFVFEEKDSNFDDFQQVREEKVPEELNEQGAGNVYSQVTDSHCSRTKSDTEPASSGEIPTRLPARVRKWASSKSAFGRFEQEDIVEVRRPATVREKGNAKAAEDDEEVDAKADVFINRFKQELKLQRMESIVRGTRT